MNTPHRPLILDLDFTLLHLEWRAGSIEVPGRTRSAWIAPQTIELLNELQSKFEIVLATARSWHGARPVWDGLQARGVNIGGAVIEDGALFGRPDAWQTMDAAFEIEALRAFVETRKSADWPAFEWQRDFEACLVARCDDPQNATVLLVIFAEQLEWPSAQLRFFRDGRKVYIISKCADKWSALQRLLEECAPLAAGVGDGENDLIWLAKVQSPCTLSGAAPAVSALVEARKGYLSPQRGHDGIVDALCRLADFG